MKKQVQGELSQESRNSARLDPECQNSPALPPPSLHVPPVTASWAAAPCVDVFVLSQALAESATSETGFHSIGNCQDCRKQVCGVVEPQPTLRHPGARAGSPPGSGCSSSRHSEGSLCQQSSQARLQIISWLL